MSLFSETLYAVDPVAFAESYLFDRDGNPWQPDAWQTEALRCQDQMAAWLCSRRSGKSATAGILGMHTAIYQPRSTTLIISKSESQAAELLATVKTHFRANEALPKLSTDSATTLTLDNHSRLKVISGSATRGWSPDLVILDEAAWISDDVWASVRPYMASKRRKPVKFRVLSTPRGKVGWMHDLFCQDDAWTKQYISADMVPSRVDPAYVLYERKKYGELYWRQEYNCEFVDSDQSLYADHLIQAALDPNLKPVFLRSII